MPKAKTIDRLKLTHKKLDADFEAEKPSAKTELFMTTCPACEKKTLAHTGNEAQCIHCGWHS